MKKCETNQLAPTIDNVNKINHQILNDIPGELVQYRSIDTVTEECEAVNYPMKFLNSLEPTGMTPHILKLRIGVPVITETLQ